MLVIPACPTCNDFHGLVQKIMELQDILAKTSAKVRWLTSAVGACGDAASSSDVHLGDFSGPMLLSRAAYQLLLRELPYKYLHSHQLATKWFNKSAVRQVTWLTLCSPQQDLLFYYYLWLQIICIVVYWSLAAHYWLGGEWRGCGLSLGSAPCLLAVEWLTGVWSPQQAALHCTDMWLCVVVTIWLIGCVTEYMIEFSHITHYKFYFLKN